MINIPLYESARYDYFDRNEITDDMTEFSFDYFYTGVRVGSKSNLIELFVVTYVMDHSENLFIRYCKYSGSKHFWKEKITEQLKTLMKDINISEGLMKSQLRFFEIEPEKYLETGSFENRFLDLKAKMKSQQ